MLRHGRWLHLLSGVVLLGLAGELNLSALSKLSDRPFDVTYVPKGNLLRIAALGHRTLVSDLYWLQAVQYIGEPKADKRGWDKLLPLIDLVTDLDPRHGYAYNTAGIVLSAAHRLDESDQILRKGMEKGPYWWSYPFYISFNYWFYRGDFERGAYYAELAAKRPGASANISHLALSLASKTGKPEDAIAVLTELRSAAKDEKTADTLDEQIKTAVLERDAQALEALVKRYGEEQGHEIATLQDLVSVGYLAALPPDPFGGSYRWDPEEKRVHSTVNPFRFSPANKPVAPQGFQYRPPKEAGP